jgi:hypothetical protein
LIHDSTLTIVPVKELMPAFIKAGIFKNDNKNGKPIRDILRELDEAGQLQLIPYLHPERRDVDTYWYFIPKDAPAPSTFYKQEEPSVKKEAAKQARLLTDKTYILDLCDAILEQKGERQKRFDFLKGDPHKDGVTRTKLPVDAYYPILKLVVDFKESPRVSNVENFDNPNVTTVSGVSRREQRQLYTKRKATTLPKHGIRFVEIPFDVFNYDNQHKLIRNPQADMLQINELLNDNSTDTIDAE